MPENTTFAEKLQRLERLGALKAAALNCFIADVGTLLVMWILCELLVAVVAVVNMISVGHGSYAPILTSVFLVSGTIREKVDNEAREFLERKFNAIDKKFWGNKRFFRVLAECHEVIQFEIKTLREENEATHQEILPAILDRQIGLLKNGLRPWSLCWIDWRQGGELKDNP